MGILKKIVLQPLCWGLGGPFFCLWKFCLDLGQVTWVFSDECWSISLLPLWSEDNIRARAIHSNSTEARHFQNLLCLMLNLFRTFLLVWLLGLPVAILFLECYANVVFRGHEGGREPCLGWAPGWWASCPSHTEYTVLCSIWWHHHFYKERKYILRALWIYCYLAYGFLWVCLPVGNEKVAHTNHINIGAYVKKEI